MSQNGRRLVVAAGAWAGALVPELHALAEPERQVLAWLQPSEPELFAPERFPVFNSLFSLLWFAREQGR